jgi:hypothetical protein
VKSTTSISKIKTEFSLQNATNVGGIKIFLDFLEKIKFAEALNQLSSVKAGNSIFPLYRVLLYLIVGWIVGCERLFHFRKLQHDSLLERLLGGRCPHHTLLYKELTRLPRTTPHLLSDLRKLITTSFLRVCRHRSSWIWTPR